MHLSGSTLKPAALNGNMGHSLGQDDASPRYRVASTPNGCSARIKPENATPYAFAYDGVCDSCRGSINRPAVPRCACGIEGAAHAQDASSSEGE